MAEEAAVSDNNSRAGPVVSGVISACESVQGRRWYMEDTFVAIDNLNEVFPNLPKENRYSIYGVFDGHGGKDTAIFCEKFLHKSLVEDTAFLQGDIASAIKSTFERLDKEILQKSHQEGWSNGSTAVLAVIKNDTLYLGNIGDSEAVLARKTSDGYEAVLISEKHKPSNAVERARIEKSGGRVFFGRVLGTLAVARALGDIEFKFPYNKAEGDFVSAEPFVNTIELTPDYEFMILACDGLWDKLTYEDAVEFVAQAKSNGKPVNEIVEMLVKNSLDKGSLDNVTTIIVDFQHQ